MGNYSFLKNPFERLSAENQDEMIKSMDSVAESLLEKGPIYTKLDSIDKKIETMTTVLGDISKKLDVKGKVKADAKEMKQMSETAKAMGQGMKWFVEALEGFAHIKDDAVDKFVVAVTKIGEAFQKIDAVTNIISKAGGVLLDMAKGLLLFGLALLFAAPIYLFALPGAILITAVIYGFLYFFSKALGDKENADKIHQGAESLAMMGVAVILFGIAMLLVGVGVYSKLIGITTVVIFGVLLAFITLFAFFLGKVLKDNLKEGVEALSMMGISVILFGIAIFLVSKIYEYLDPLNAAGALGMILLTMAAIAGIFFLLSFADKNIREGAEAMFIMAGTIILLGLSLWAFGKLMSMIENPWETMAMAGVALLGLALVMIVLGKAQGDLVKGALGMLISTLTILALGFVLWTWQKWGIEWETLAIAGAAIAGLALVMGIAGMVGANIALGALALTLAALPLFTLGYTLSYWQKEAITWETLGIVGAAITGLAVVMGIAGIASPIIALGAGALLLAGGALISIAYGLDSFKKSGWSSSDSDDLNGALGSMIAGFLGYKSIDEVGPGALLWVPMLSGLLIASSAGLSIAGMALNTISKGLKGFKSAGFSSADGGELEAVMASVISAFTLITDSDRQKKLGIDASPFKLMIGTMALSGIGNVMTDLARGIQNFANMKFVEYEVVKDPKTGMSKIQPKSIVELSDAKIEAAGLNFGKVIDAILEPIRKVGEAEASSDGWFSGGHISKGIQALTGIGGIMTDMAKGIQDLASLNFVTYEVIGAGTADAKLVPKEVVTLKDADFTRAGEGFAKIVGAILGPISQVGQAEMNSEGWFSGGSVSKGIASLTGIGNIMTGMADGILKLAGGEFVTQEIFRDPKTGQTKLQPGKVVKITDSIIAAAGISFSKIVGAMLGSIIAAGTLIDEHEDEIEQVTDYQEDILKFVTGIGKFAKDWSDLKNPIGLGVSFDFFTRSIMSTFDPKKNPVQNLAFFTLFADKLSMLGKQASDFEKMADSFERIADSMGEFKDNLNSLDKDLLAQTRGLFDAMAIISKSDSGDKFLKKYSDSLKDTFEKLHELLQEFKGSVDSNTAVQAQVVASTTAAAATTSDTKGATSQTPAAQAQTVDMSGVINAINQLKTTLTTQGIS